MLKKYKFQKAGLLIVFQLLILNSYSEANRGNTIRGLGFSKDSLKVDKEPVFGNTKVLPEYPGGMLNLFKLISENLKYPEEAKKKNIQGRVVVNFVVEKDGSLTNMKVIRGLGHGCDEEALRVMSLSPKWKPGMQNGETIRVSYSVPVMFKN